jgi:hypothetical protein
MPSSRVLADAASRLRKASGRDISWGMMDRNYEVETFPPWPETSSRAVW